MSYFRVFLLNLLILAVASGPLLVAPATLEGSAWADDDDDDDDGGGDDDDAPVRRPQRQEVVILGLTDGDRDRLTARGYQVSGMSQSALLDRSISRVSGPPGRSLQNLLNDIRTVAPNATSARNDTYRRFAYQPYQAAGTGCSDACEAFELTSWQPAIGRCGTDITIGVIDTRVDQRHPSLDGANVRTKSVRRPDLAASDAAHGTGVVSLLAGKPGSPVSGLVPNARVLAVDAFHQAPGGDQADVFDLVAALDWLVGERAQVINMSLAGPGNPVLEAALNRSLSKGISIVAAVGRPGSASSGYPARYDGVIAVSAVDSRLRGSRLATRGDHVAFAAPGVGLNVAGVNQSVVLVNGTSFAAPFVAAALALRRASGETMAEAASSLQQSAKDLGAPGRDPIFGWGLVQFAETKC